MLFRIMIPQAELRQPLLEPTPAEKADGVTLQAPPRVGWVTYLSIVATTPGVELAPFPAFPSALIHRGSLASQTLWVTAHEEPPNVAQADSLRTLKREIADDIVARGGDPDLGDSDRSSTRLAIKMASASSSTLRLRVANSVVRRV